MTTNLAYERDVIAWANEQASLLRAGRFDLLDIEHLAEEIEDVGKSEQRELASRMAVLLAHLLKWRFQPERRGRSWQTIIRVQRNALSVHLESVPSLKATLNDAAWWTKVWADAVSKAIEETGLDLFPEQCPWAIQEILDPDWKPE
ncbi:DUF29 domain-containing protein [uncultured Thiocystis sp.]|jgi:hypothetical protein|uniref:DUF29 domain-containing protein n=1 Tax=uncultured Thiocystis sp. TaxID=1202134 RepID=UPI0025E1F73C|nr:DUF29 domain-containing protein [uncultured Thiocystis sp.]